MRLPSFLILLILIFFRTNLSEPEIPEYWRQAHGPFDVMTDVEHRGTGKYIEELSFC
jgi:hypothetical protein